MTQSLEERYDPFGPNDPYSLYAQARRDKPIFFSDRLGCWVVTRLEDVHAIARDPVTFSSKNALKIPVDWPPAVWAELAHGWPFASTAITTDGSDHARRREPLAKAFSQDAADRLEPVIRARAEELLDGFAAAGRVDLRAAYCEPLPRTVTMRLFAIQEQDEPTVIAGAHALGLLPSAPLPEDEQVRLARDLVAVQHLAARYARQRRDQPGEDLLSALVALHAPGAGPLTEDQTGQIVTDVVENLFASHATGQDQLANGLWTLLAHPDQWTLLCARPAELAERAVEEYLRFDPGVPGLCRVATRPVTVAGQDLPEGAELFLLYASANRDPALVENPDRFDITRPPSRHFAFGYGRHFCAGAPVARTVQQVGVEVLARRLPGLRLAAEGSIVTRPIYNIRGPQELRVEWGPQR